jgi:hypothetical protein
MLKLILIFAASLAAAIPASFLYLGILKALRPLLEKLRLNESVPLTRHV